MKRIEIIDIAKGIGIFLVVIGHLISMNSYPGKVIYSFHMPLFFFLSGVCFNQDKYLKFSSFLCNRLKSLIWPCLCFTVLISIMQALILDIPISQLKTELPGALWFLPILFIAEIIYYPIQVLKKRYIVFILCIFYLMNVRMLPN